MTRHLWTAAKVCGSLALLTAGALIGGLALLAASVDKRQEREQWL